MIGVVFIFLLLLFSPPILELRILSFQVENTLREKFKMSTPYGLPSDASQVKLFEWDDHIISQETLLAMARTHSTLNSQEESKIAVSFVINYEGVRYL